jgi:phage terminase large subunit
LGLWQGRSKLLSETFQWTKTRIFAKEHPEAWWCSARTWAKSADKDQQANTLAGLHSDYILFVLDESGGMSDAIMASAEAALSSCIEGHIVQAGNPTHLSGPLYGACTRERRLWFVVDIDGDPDNPKRASRVSIERARQQIEKYGRDNPFVLVNVFGQFPPSSLNALSAQTRSEWRKDGSIVNSRSARPPRCSALTCLDSETTQA